MRLFFGVLTALFCVSTSHAAERGQIAEISCPFTKLTNTSGTAYPTAGLKFLINLANKNVVTKCIGRNEEICILDGSSEVLEVTEKDGSKPSFLPIKETTRSGHTISYAGLNHITLQGSNGDDTDIFVRLGFDAGGPTGAPLTVKAFMTTACDESLSSLSDFVACKIVLK